MKVYMLLPLCLLVGCASKQVQTKQAKFIDNPASPVDCKTVYKHILNIVVDTEVDPEHSFTPVEKDAAAWETDAIYASMGTKDRFLITCNHSMTKAQTDCALHSTMTSDINMCVKLIH